jgi:flagellar hook-length control protein FliK
VVGVTLDVAASAPIANAQAKPIRSDPLPPTDSFGALIDGNTPPDATSGPPPAPEPPAQPPANAQAQANNPPPRDPADSPTDPSSLQNHAAAPGVQQPVSSDAAANPASVDNSDEAPATKAGSGKGTDGKSASEKPAAKTSADASKTDSMTAADLAPLGAPVAAPTPVATAIVNTAAAATPATSAQAFDSNAPLAIAASAIATTSSTVATLGAPATQLKAGPTAATGTAATIGQTPLAKQQAQGAATLAAGQQQPAQTETEAVEGFVTTTGHGATPSLSSKAAPPKTSTGLQTKMPWASAASDSAASAASASPTTPPASADGKAAPQAPATPKQDADAPLGNAVKADKADGAPSTAPSPVAHDSAAVTATPQPAGQDPSAQPAALPQQLTTAPPLAPTGTPAVTIATSAPVPVSGLAVEIAASAQSGKTRFEMRLDPADLGRIDVRIDVNRDGQVTSHLIVEKAETLSMLQQDAPQLQQALSDAGLKTGSGGLQFSLRDQSSFGGQNNGNQQMQGNVQRLIVSDETSLPPSAVAGKSYGRMLGLVGGVDIRV